jgi:hypothetical protein
MAGLAGVLATLVTRIAPEPLSTETISVKVPPVSMPIRRWARRSVMSQRLACAAHPLIRRVSVPAIKYGQGAAPESKTD